MVPLKQPTPRFQAFLSYAAPDEAQVERLARRLQQSGLLLWFAPWHAVPGRPVQEQMEQALQQCAACVILIGSAPVQGWQNEELRLAILRRVEEDADVRVIPVLLPGAREPEVGALPFALRRTFHPGLLIRFVDLETDERPFRRLVAGILGQAPGPDDLSLPPPAPSGPERLHIYLCHTPADADAATALARQLARQAVDAWRPPPGVLAGEALNQALSRVQAVVVLLGPNEPAWRDAETAALLQRFAQRRVPILLARLTPGAQGVRFPASVWAVDITPASSAQLATAIRQLVDPSQFGPWQSETRLGVDVTAPQLQQLLLAHFDAEELRNLAFDLGIDYQDLPAATISGLARELVAYCARNHRLSELARLAFWHRPNAPW